MEASDGRPSMIPANSSIKRPHEVGAVSFFVLRGTAFCRIREDFEAVDLETFVRFTSATELWVEASGGDPSATPAISGMAPPHSVRAVTIFGLRAATRLDFGDFGARLVIEAGARFDRFFATNLPAFAGLRCDVFETFVTLRFIAAAPSTFGVYRACDDVRRVSIGAAGGESLSDGEFQGFSHLSQARGLACEGGGGVTTVVCIKTALRTNTRSGQER